MTSKRLQIRNAMADILQGVGGVTTVCAGRYKPVGVSECPFLRVLADSETCEDYSDAWQQRRVLTLTVEIYVEDEDDVEEAACEIESAILKRLANKTGTYLNDLLSEPLTFQSYEFTGDDAPEQETAAAVLSFEAVYLVEPDVEDAVPLQTVEGTIEGRMGEVSASIPVRVTGLYEGQDGQNDQG